MVSLLKSARRVRGSWVDGDSHHVCEGTCRSVACAKRGRSFSLEGCTRCGAGSGRGALHMGTEMSIWAGKTAMSERFATDQCPSLSADSCLCAVLPDSCPLSSPGFCHSARAAGTGGVRGARVAERGAGVGRPRRPLRQGMQDCRVPVCQCRRCRAPLMSCLSTAGACGRR
jgi:hypothetical protein